MATLGLHRSSTNADDENAVLINTMPMTSEPTSETPEKLDDLAGYFKQWGTKNTKSSSVQSHNWERFEAADNPVVRCEFHDHEDSPLIESGLAFTTAATFIAGFAITDFGSFVIDEWSTSPLTVNQTDTSTNETFTRITHMSSSDAIATIYVTTMAFV